MTDQIIIFPLFSGSKGNSTLIKCNGKNYLIDVGGTKLKIQNKLILANVLLKDIDGIFITHNHSDHVQALLNVMKETNANIYATKIVIDQIKRNNEKINTNRLIEIDNEANINKMTVTTFNLSHDVQTVGYKFSYNGEEFSYLTDLGCYTKDIVDKILGSNKVLVESNHDENLLKKGKYPYPLKKRILSQSGHLSNSDCASLCRELYLNGTRKFILGHLSEENNYPELAYNTVNSVLSKLGNDYKLYVTTRNGLEESV